MAPLADGGDPRPSRAGRAGTLVDVSTSRGCFEASRPRWGARPRVVEVGSCALGFGGLAPGSTRCGSIWQCWAGGEGGGLGSAPPLVHRRVASGSGMCSFRDEKRSQFELARWLGTHVGTLRFKFRAVSGTAGIRVNGGQARCWSSGFRPGGSLRASAPTRSMPRLVRECRLRQPPAVSPPPLGALRMCSRPPGLPRRIGAISREKDPHLHKQCGARGGT